MFSGKYFLTQFKKFKKIVKKIVLLSFHLLYDVLDAAFEKKYFKQVIFFYGFMSFLLIPFFKKKPSLKSRIQPVSLYSVDSVQKNCQKKNTPFKLIKNRSWVEVCSPLYCSKQDGVIKNKPGKIFRFLLPEMYVAEIYDANVIGENSVVLVDNICLQDMIQNDVKGRLNLRYGSVLHMNSCHAIIGNKKLDKICIPEAIYLIGFAAFNYYHLTIEILGRLEYIERIKEYDGIPLLVDEIICAVPQYKYLLNVINKKGYPVIPLKKNHPYSVGRLILPSSTCCLPINVNGFRSRPEDYCVSKETLKFIRNRILEHFQINFNDSTDTKIFISRKNTKNIRLTNEDLVLELFIKHGFEIIYPEMMSLEEQVKVFASAQIVAGVTGAAFTNILYCQENTVVINIIPEKYEFYLYSTIAHNLNLKPVFFDAQIVKKGKTASSEQFNINIEMIEVFLSNGDSGDGEAMLERKTGRLEQLGFMQPRLY
jgi:hypothetical protein